MPINPNIAMGVNPIQFKQSDPYEAFGKQLQLKKLLMGEQDDQIAREAMQGTDGSPQSVLAQLVKRGANPSMISAYQKMAQEASQHAADADYKKSQTGENNAKIEKAATDQHNAQLQHIQSPADLNGWVQAMYQHPILGPKISKMMPIEKYLSQMPQTPEQFQQWKAEQTMGTGEFLKANKPHFTTETANGKVTQLQTPSLFGGTPVATRSTFAADPAKDLVLPDASGVYSANKPLVAVKSGLAKDGKTSINNTISVAGPENAYNKEIGEGLAKESLGVVASAKAAPEAIRTAQGIRNAISKGAFTGTGADLRYQVTKAMETAGMVGEGRAASTEALAADLGKITLDGVKSSGLGSGNGFTDKDREFLEKAKSGKIDMTPQNLNRVADLAERVARTNHSKGLKVVERWKGEKPLSNIVKDVQIDALPNSSTPNGAKFLGFE